MATIAQHRSVKVQIREHGLAHVADYAAYWLILAGVYLMYGFLFFYASREKLFINNGTMPAGLVKAFHGSLVASFPGDNAAWLILGIIEFIVVILLAASLATGEFLPSRRKPVLLTGLGLSIFTFGLMAFANNMISNTATAAELFGYLSGTVVVIILLLLMPPYRTKGWLSNLTER